MAYRYPIIARAENKLDVIKLVGKAFVLGKEAGGILLIKEGMVLSRTDTILVNANSYLILETDSGDRIQLDSVYIPTAVETVIEMKSAKSDIRVVDDKDSPVVVLQEDTREAWATSITENDDATADRDVAELGDSTYGFDTTPFGVEGEFLVREDIFRVEERLDKMPAGDEVTAVSVASAAVAAIDDVTLVSDVTVSKSFNENSGLQADVKVDAFNRGGGEDALISGNITNVYAFDIALKTSHGVVVGFDSANDKLYFEGVPVTISEEADLNDLTAVATVSVEGKDVRIDFNSGDSFVFSGVDDGTISQISDLLSNANAQIIVSG